MVEPLEDSDIAATGTVLNGPGLVYSVVLTPAAAIATLVLRDGGGAGRVIKRLQAAASGNSASWTSDKPLRCGTDIHATLGGAGANVNVGFHRSK